MAADCRVPVPYKTRQRRFFDARIRGNSDLFVEFTSGRFVRDIHAAAVHVKLPAVIKAAQAVFLVASEKQRRAAMGADVVNEADPALRVAEGDEVFAQQTYAERGTVLLGQVRGLQDGNPVLPHEAAHRRSGADAGEELVF